MEKRNDLVKRDDVDALVDAMAGTVLTHLSGMAARCSRDLVVRRNIDAVVMQIRREFSEACSKMADAERRAATGCRRMTDVEMTDAQVRQQVERADRFIERLRDMITATARRPDKGGGFGCCPLRRRGSRW